MKHPHISVKIFSTSGAPPVYGSDLSSGCDLRALLADPVHLAPLERRSIPTGIYLEIPPGFEAQIRPRSGQALRRGLTIPNAPGTIDADYRGEVRVAVINLSSEELIIEPGERIAQMVFAPVVHAAFILSDSEDQLADSVRGQGGFGSTGMN